MMKYFVLLFLGLLVLTRPISAHPPSEIELEFNPFEYTLSVIIHHAVNDPGKHYIYKVSVELNGEEIIKQKFKYQYNEDAQLALYQIHDAREGDEITVTAYCSISGKKEATIVVEEAYERDE
jgi:desulfoferrodoxin (superoxide reductase-like protein)